ncbi:SAV_915 family protein [Streptomyces sp. NPDC004561]
MGAPIRSRLLDFMEPDPPEREPDRGRSHLLDLVDAAPAPGPAADARPRPKPGVPAYSTPVFVPAHPRSVVGTGADGHPARVPFIVCELFAHPAHGTVAFAFTGLDKLVEALGEAQPWVAASIGPLAEAMDERGVTVLLDPRLAPGEPNWRPEDLTAYAREVRR